MKELRIAIFIDYHNTISELNRQIEKKYEYIKEHKSAPLYKYIISNKGEKKSISYLKSIVWKNFNDVVLKNLSRKKPSSSFDHVGTYITLGIRKVKNIKYKDKKLYDKLREISLLDGFIVHFELSRENQYGSPKEYGVDSNIACQMLLGAFKDHYDIAVLVSNDQDFIPAIELVQNSYGKKIYHLGPGKHLKTASYGSIDFEPFFQTILEINNE